MLGALPALLANGWTAYAPGATLAGGLGLGAVALALLGAGFLPGFLRRPLIGLGLALLVGGALYQAGQAHGAHEAFARDAARALAAEEARTAAARRVTDALDLQATRDLAAAQADAHKLQELNDALAHDPRRAGVCLDRGLARRLRAL